MPRTERQIAYTPHSIVLSAKWRSGVRKEIANFRRAEVLESSKPFTPSPLNQATALLVEMLAEAQAQRRQATGDSAAFHNLTGAIVAYGKALGLLVVLKRIQDQPRTQPGSPCAPRESEQVFGLPAVASSSGQRLELRI